MKQDPSEVDDPVEPQKGVSGSATMLIAETGSLKTWSRPHNLIGSLRLFPVLGYHLGASKNRIDRELIGACRKV